MRTSSRQTRQAGRETLIRVLVDTAVHAETVRDAMRTRDDVRPVDLTALRNAEDTIFSLARTLAIVDEWENDAAE